MTETTTITIIRQVPVGVERAFDAWVDPAELTQWWWPQWPDTTYDLDPRERGGYRIYSSAVGMGVIGTFTAVSCPGLLEMTWAWVNSDELTQVDSTSVIDTVEVRFTPTADGTEVTVRHTSTEHDTDGGVEQGWNDVMDRLPCRFTA